MAGERRKILSNSRSRKCFLFFFSGAGGSVGLYEKISDGSLWAVKFIKSDSDAREEVRLMKKIVSLSGLFFHSKRSLFENWLE